MLSLLGFRGVNVTVLVQGSPAYRTFAKVSVAAPNEWIRQRYDPGGPRDFMELPSELRREVYKGLVPHHCVITSSSQRAIIIAPMLRLNNRLITRGYLETLHTTRCFHFMLPAWSQLPRHDPAPWVTSSLLRIGEMLRG